MQVRCASCHQDYDDARCWTFCPHEAFLSPELFAQKDLACSLLGKAICFAHMPHGERFRVTSVDYEGMVTIDKLPGLFAPHVFVHATEDHKPGH